MSSAHATPAHSVSVTPPKGSGPPYFEVHWRSAHKRKADGTATPVKKRVGPA